MTALLAESLLMDTQTLTLARKCVHTQVYNRSSTLRSSRII